MLKPKSTWTLIGTGTSTGVPIIGCKCKVCKSRDSKNKRLRTAAWVQTNGKSFLIDTSTDLREQALRAKIPRVDAVLYTHPHADHIHGIDELRCYNFMQKGPIPLFGNEWTTSDLTAKFPYIFSPKPVEGGGIPELILNKFDASAASLDVLGVNVIPVSLSHGSKESVGFRIDSVAYVTDCSYIPDLSVQKLRGLDTLVLDCVRIKEHRTHFNIDRALEFVEKVTPKRTYLTHLGHDFDYKIWSKKLPKGVFLAYDGLTIKTH